MPSVITNVGGSPQTVPLNPAAMIPKGERAIYANMEPDEVIAALGGGALVAKLGLIVSPLDVAQAPANENVTALGGVVVIPPGGVLPDASAKYRGTVAIVQGDTGEADSLAICLKDSSDAYNWITLS